MSNKDLYDTQKFIPKQDEMIEVSEDTNEWYQKEFIAMTAYDKYLCWHDNKAFAYSWNYARPVQKFPILKKSKSSDLVVMFTNRNSGYVVVSTPEHTLGSISDKWADYDYEDFWENVDGIPDKALIWCWGTLKPNEKILRFYDIENKSTFSADLYARDGVAYDNYQIADTSKLEPEMLEWANEAQMTLKD